MHDHARPLPTGQAWQSSGLALAELIVRNQLQLQAGSSVLAVREVLAISRKGAPHPRWRSFPSFLRRWPPPRLVGPPGVGRLGQPQTAGTVASPYGP